VSKPNGVAISPDGKTLYVAEHDNGTDNIDPAAPPPEQGPMKIYAFPLGDDGLVSGPRRTFYDFGDEKGCDGMCVDEAGRVYLTVRSNRRPGVLVLSPEAKELAHIPTGPQNQQPGSPEGTVGLPSNVEFGRGAEANVLYITVDTSLYRIPLKVKGFHVQYAR
jgi:gluconolactonase